MRLNRDIYQKDPTTQKLVNEGVATVNDDKSAHALEVLRYELETFVCDGQYQKGITQILETFLKKIDTPQQEGVWISGFFGSGKSHLVKMLRALWEDTGFADGATARGIANLPEDIKVLLKELSTQGKRHGGLHAASGTLGASSQDQTVRLAILNIIFKSAGLPANYATARFVMWLKKQRILDEVRALVEEAGLDWNEELDNFYIAEKLHEALLEVKPELFASMDALQATLNNMFPYVKDVSSEEMVKAVSDALSHNGIFPLTLLVLDEVQQYIGENSQRSMDVQEAVEACSKQFGGKLLLIGTGQTAVSGTPNLNRLAGRFTIRIELSDADVDAVIRKVILAKKPDATTPVSRVMESNIGEISRQLAGTTIAHRQQDSQYFVQDYPLLPVRRRFWELALRELDRSGTESQLRNQLSMVHNAIKTNVDKPLGNIIPADYLFFDSADKLLQYRILPRNVYERILKLQEGTEDECLTARACGLVFLINKIADSNRGVGLKPNPDTLADLLVEDLAVGSASLRSRLPGLLDKCDLLIKVGDDYRIQTPESAAWNDDFFSQRSQIANESHRLETARNELIRDKFRAYFERRLTVTQGSSKVPREVTPYFDATLPKDADRKIYLWIRDGWSTEENSVRAEARQAGNASPVIFVFLHKRSADELRKNLLDSMAAHTTLERKGVNDTPEGREARAAIETTKAMADEKINELLDQAMAEAVVLQGGGSELTGNSLMDRVLEAANNSAVRLYPRFDVADHAKWERVLEKARQGAENALEEVGHTGEVTQNPVCKEILGFLPVGKKGIDIRTHFEAPPFGWPQDAIDGALFVLMASGHIQATDERGTVINSRSLERKAIGKAVFKAETANVNATQKIEIRKLYIKLGMQVRQNEEAADAKAFLDKAQELAEKAGGVPPRPAAVDTSMLDEIRQIPAGNQQLLAMWNVRDKLAQCLDEWKMTAEKIDSRWPSWVLLEGLCRHAGSLPDAETLARQAEIIREERQLLAEPDPLSPLIAQITALLRNELNELDKQYKNIYQTRLEALDSDPNWQKLQQEERHNLLAQHRVNLSACPKVEVGTSQQVLDTLNALPLDNFRDRVEALDSLFNKVALSAAQKQQPETKSVTLPPGIFNNKEEIEKWISQVREKLLAEIEKGPIVIQ